jgi:transposase
MKEGCYSSKLRQEIKNLFPRSFMMTAMHTLQTAPSGAVLYLAFELGWTEWKLGFSTGLAGAPRLRTMRARDLRALWDEIAGAQKRVGLSDDAGV